jgi:dihydrofolate synthase / folylpolyglutamate synthase
VARIRSRAEHGIKPGLARVARLLDALAAPHEGYPVVQIAGTNGKTSTTRMIAALAGAHGLTTGSFTSPHLDVVEDQIEYAGRPMTRHEFAAAVTEVEPVAELVDERSGDPITAFELLTAIAFSWFAERSVDLAVIEAGMGGRDDATNVARSEVAVVTSVSSDHAEHLGGSIDSAAAHKLAILDDDASLVTGPLGGRIEALAESTVQDRRARWFRYGESFRPADVRRAVGGWLFDVEGAYDRYTEVALRVRGRHQVTNFSVAVAAVEALLGRSLDVAGIREVAAALSIPGRMEILGSDPLLLVDAAHNPEGVAALVAAVAEEYPTTEWTVVFGAMADKDVAEMVRLMAPLVGTVIATAADTPRALPPDRVATIASAALGVPVGEVTTVAEAVRHAASLGRPVLATGSIAVVGEARRGLSPRRGDYPAA